VLADAVTVLTCPAGSVQQRGVYEPAGRVQALDADVLAGGLEDVEAVEAETPRTSGGPVDMLVGEYDHSICVSKACVSHKNIVVSCRVLTWLGYAGHADATAAPCSLVHDVQKAVVLSDAAMWLGAC
jgi:hypothetical protein